MVGYNSPRILITRLSHLGDCIQTVPMLNALRDLFPTSFIAWMTEPGPATLLQKHPSLDELLICPKRDILSPARTYYWHQRLKSYQFDIAIDPQGLTKSSMFGWLSGAPTRIGFTRPDSRELSPCLNNLLVKRSTENVVERYLELLQPLGGIKTMPRYEISLTQQAFDWADDYVNRLTWGTEGLVVLNAGAGWPSRMWETDRFADLAQYLATHWNLASVSVWAGAREQRIAAQIAYSSDGTVRMAPPTSLPQLAALLKQATLYVGTDSGPLHLAVAMGTQCVSLHGTTLATKSGPFGKGHAAVQAYYQHGSSFQRRQAANDAMRAISVDMARTACDYVLQESQFTLRNTCESRPTPRADYSNRQSFQPRFPFQPRFQTAASQVSNG